MEPLRIIQVGLGGWGQDWYERIVRYVADVKPVAYVDIDAETMARAQMRCKLPSDLCFDSLERALEATDAEAVLITASLPGHVPAALTALAAGKHVLIEKPFAPTLAAAQQVVAAAAEANKVLMVSQNYRFFPAPRAVAAVVRDHIMGQVGVVQIDFRANYNAVSPRRERHHQLVHPLLMDMAIHHFDLMRLVLNQEPVRVTCEAVNPSWSNYVYPPAAFATILFDGGTVVNYSGSWVSPSPKTFWAGNWRMECAGGEVLWTSRNGRDLSGERVALRPLGQGLHRMPLPELAYIGRAGSLAAFVQAVRTGVEPETSGRANLGTLALMEAMIRSATSGAAETL